MVATLPSVNRAGEPSKLGTQIPEPRTWHIDISMKHRLRESTGLDYVQDRSYMRKPYVGVRTCISISGYGIIHYLTS